MSLTHLSGCAHRCLPCSRGRGSRTERQKKVLRRWDQSACGRWVVGAAQQGHSLPERSWGAAPPGPILWSRSQYMRGFSNIPTCLSCFPHPTCREVCRPLFSCPAHCLAHIVLVCVNCQGTDLCARFCQERAFSLSLTLQSRPLWVAHTEGRSDEKPLLFKRHTGEQGCLVTVWCELRARRKAGVPGGVPRSWGRAVPPPASLGWHRSGFRGFRRKADSSLSLEDDAGRLEELQELLEKQDFELSQARERLVTLTAAVADLEGDLGTARRDLIKSEELSSKHQRDLREVSRAGRPLGLGAGVQLRRATASMPCVQRGAR